MEKKELERLKAYLELLYSIKNDNMLDKVDEKYIKILKENNKDNERIISKKM